MAIYYTIESEGLDSSEKIKDREQVCLIIRSKKLKDFKVYEKDDSQVKSMSFGTASSFPLAPMCNDITSEILVTLDIYKKMEEEEGPSTLLQ